LAGERQIAAHADGGVVLRGDGSGAGGREASVTRCNAALMRHVAAGDGDLVPSTARSVLFGFMLAAAQACMESALKCMLSPTYRRRCGS